MRVEIYNEEYPVGMNFDFGGLLLPNGTEIEFNQEELDAFETRNKVSVEDMAKGNQFVKVNGQTHYVEPEVEEEVEEPQLELSENPEAGEGGEN